MAEQTTLVCRNQRSSVPQNLVDIADGAATAGVCSHKASRKFESSLRRVVLVDCESCGGIFANSLRARAPDKMLSVAAAASRSRSSSWQESPRLRSRQRDSVSEFSKSLRRPDMILQCAHQAAIVQPHRRFGIA